MFNGKKSEYDGFSTVIAKGVKVEGATLTGVGMVRIDGEFLGEMDIDGEVILGESGTFEGNIHSKSALVAGKVLGNLFVVGSVHLTSTSEINGNIEATSLVIDEGASFSGNSKMRGRNNNVEPINILKDVDII